MSSELGRWYVGIDPGVSGGMAMLYRGHKLTDVVCAFNMPGSYELVYTLVWDEIGNTVPTSIPYYNPDSEPVVYIEKVTGYVGSPSVGAHMFVLGENSGIWKCAVRAVTGYFPKEVGANCWQRALGIPARRKKSKTSAGESREEYKRRLKAHAQGLFPTLKVTLNTADALLLAEYAWRVSAGLCDPPGEPKKRKRKKRGVKKGGI